MSSLSELGGATRAATSAWLHRLARHQRAVTATFVGLGVLAGIAAVRPADGRTLPVIAVVHDLAAGVALSASDLTTLQLPRSAVPAAALTSIEKATGRTLAGPMGRGEVLTQTRLAGAALLGAGTDHVAVPVRIADAGSAALLHAGDHVDLLAAPHDGGLAQVVAADVAVLVVPASASGLDDGALVVVACSAATAQRLASAAVSSRISVVLRGH